VTNPGGLALGNELRFPDLQDGANYRIPPTHPAGSDQIRDTFYWSLASTIESFARNSSITASDILFDIFGSEAF